MSGVLHLFFFFPSICHLSVCEYLLTEHSIHFLNVVTIVVNKSGDMVLCYHSNH